MTPTRWLDPGERQTWLALLAVTMILPATLDKPLQRTAGITLFDYNVLAMLSETRKGLLTMTDLASRTNASLSRLSHVVKKLEGRGWVRRGQHPDDARVTVVDITPSGREEIESLAPMHVESVRQAVFDGLEPDEVSELCRIAGKIVTRLDPQHRLLRDPDLR